MTTQSDRDVLDALESALEAYEAYIEVTRTSLPYPLVDLWQRSSPMVDDDAPEPLWLEFRPSTPLGIAFE